MKYLKQFEIFNVDFTHGWTLETKDGVYVDFGNSRKNNTLCPLFTTRNCDGVNFRFHHTQRAYKGSDNYKTANGHINLSDIYPHKWDYVYIPIKDVVFIFRYEYETHMMDIKLNKQDIIENTSAIRFGL
jgi:hypothetical protein